MPRTGRMKVNTRCNRAWAIELLSRSAVLQQLKTGARMAFSGAIPKTYTQSRASISPMLLDNYSLPAERSPPALEPAGAVVQNSKSSQREYRTNQRAL